MEKHNMSRSSYLPKGSPNAAPATKWHSNITKYCACHEKLTSNISKDFKSTLQHHQIQYSSCHEKSPSSKDFKKHEFCETSSKITTKDLSYSTLSYSTLSYCYSQLLLLLASPISYSTLSYSPLRFSYSQLPYCVGEQKFVYQIISEVFTSLE